MRYTDKEKAKLLELISQSSLPVKEACKLHGISKASYYTWRKQFAAKSQALESEKTKPKENHKEEYGVDTEAVEKLLALKKEHPYFGIIKLSKQLQRSEGIYITPNKVKRILEDHGFETKEPPAAPPKGTRRFERLEPNELWMMDIMYYRLKKEGRFYLISVLDDYSRYVVAHRVFTTQTADNVIQVFKQAVENHGLPNQVLTDRGKQFHNWKGISHFQELLWNLGVEHILTSPHSPQTIGKIESFHRNIQRELLRQKEFSTIKQVQEAIKQYVDYYNHERVHMGIGYLTPADRYFGVADEVEKMACHPNPDAHSFYLVGKLDGQPVRVEKDPKGKITVYLAGHPLKELKDHQELKQLLLPSKGLSPFPKNR